MKTDAVPKKPSPLSQRGSFLSCSHASLPEAKAPAEAPNCLWIIENVLRFSSWSDGAGCKMDRSASTAARTLRTGSFAYPLSLVLLLVRVCLRILHLIDEKVSESSEADYSSTPIGAGLAFLSRSCSPCHPRCAFPSSSFISCLTVIPCVRATASPIN
jgi:hypothetical protein